VTPVVLTTVEYESLLWVISGHWPSRFGMSALPQRADMLSFGINVC
jgi:hypothetical protein